jgi:hypothetical protein
MSEERFDRLENQLEQIIQTLTTIQAQIDGVEIGLPSRLDRMESTLLVAMRSGFDSLTTTINARKHRRRAN